MSANRGRFRAEALPAPERLDRLVQIVHPNTWLALTCAAVLAAIALGWAIAGRLPAVVTGQGVLTRSAAGDRDGPVAILYFSQQDGRRIAPGMRIHLTPESISRERFGSMLAIVTAVSTSPVTKERIAAVVGNAEVADMLLQQGAAVEVSAEVLRDPSTYSGYRWSFSGGPPLHVPAGAALGARATVEGRAPISYLLPFLRSTAGAS